MKPFASPGAHFSRCNLSDAPLLSWKALKSCLFLGWKILRRDSANAMDVDKGSAKA